MLFHTTAWMVYGPKLQLPIDKTIWTTFALLVYFVMMATFVIAAKSQWQHEDALLEQKHTQLEIALLRDEMKEKGA